MNGSCAVHFYSSIVNVATCSLCSDKETSSTPTLRRSPDVAKNPSCTGCFGSRCPVSVRETRHGGWQFEKGQPHHHRDAGEPFLRQLLRRACICAGKPLSQRERSLRRHGPQVC